MLGEQQEEDWTRLTDLREIWRIEPIKELELDLSLDPLLVVSPQVLPVPVSLIKHLQMGTRVNSNPKSRRVTRPFAPLTNFGRQNQFWGFLSLDL
jgi:hypothetical protein